MKDYRRWLAPSVLLVAWFGLANADPVKTPDVKKAEDKKTSPFTILVNGQILEVDPPDKGRRVPGKIHAVRLIKGKTYLIDMMSVEVDSYLRLEDSAGNQLAEDDDSGGNLNARIRFTVTKDDVYLIHATTLGGGFGNYTLTVKEFGQASLVKALAMPAVAVGKPSEVKEKLALNDPKGPYRDHPSKVHSIEMKAGKTYVIDLISDEFDCHLFLQSAEGGDIAQNDDANGTLNSQLIHQPAETATFRLVATTHNGQVGAYTIKVTEK